MATSLTKRQQQKVRGLDRALARLNDPGKDTFKARFDAHFPRNGDELTAVLKGHLLAEELLYEIVAIFVRDASTLEQARLSFAQVLALVRAMSPFPSNYWLWTALADLNAIRNRLAHKLDSADAGTRCRKLASDIAARRNGRSDRSEPGRHTLSVQLPFLLGYLAAHATVMAEANRRGATDLLAIVLRSRSKRPTK